MRIADLPGLGQSRDFFDGGNGHQLLYGLPLSIDVPGFAHVLQEVRKFFTFPKTLLEKFFVLS